MVDEIQKLSRVILTRDTSILEQDVDRASGLKVYLNNFYQGLLEVAYEVYPSVLEVLSKEKFDGEYVKYLDLNPPTQMSINNTTIGFWKFLEKNKKYALCQLAKLDSLFTQIKKNQKQKMMVDKMVLSLYLNDKLHEIKNLNLQLPYDIISIVAYCDERGDVRLV